MTMCGDYNGYKDDRQLKSVSYPRQVGLFSCHVALFVHNMFLYCSCIKLLCSVHFLACLASYWSVVMCTFVFSCASDFGIQNSGTWTLAFITAYILQLGCLKYILLITDVVRHFVHLGDMSEPWRKT